MYCAVILCEQIVHDSAPCVRVGDATATAQFKVRLTQGHVSRNISVQSVVTERCSDSYYCLTSDCKLLQRHLSLTRCIDVSEVRVARIIDGQSHAHYRSLSVSIGNVHKHSINKHSLNANKRTSARSAASDVASCCICLILSSSALNALLLLLCLYVLCCVCVNMQFMMANCHRWQAKQRLYPDVTAAFQLNHIQPKRNKTSLTLVPVLDGMYQVHSEHYLST
jgi:hypothetical protein